jgi:hypothetical protein
MKNLPDYRCWYDLLNLSNRKEWSRDVEVMFGGAADLPFAEWLAYMAPHFERIGPLVMKEVSSSEAFQQFKDDFTPREGVVVFLHLLAPKTRILDDVRRLLDERHTGRPGRPQLDDWADIKMVGKPNLHAINKKIEVYRSAKRTHPNWTQWRIGQKCKVNLNQLTAHKDDPVAERNRKRVLSVTVNRHLKAAGILIRGVERGVFPAMSDDTPCPWKAYR